MRDLAVLFLHLLTTIARLAGPGGARSVVAESVLLKAATADPQRIVAGMCVLLVRPSRLVRSAIVLTPATLFRLHRALKTRKYRLLFSSTVPKKPGPPGPSQDVMAAVVAMKQRNPTWGCPRIAQQIALAFGVSLNKDVVRRILAAGTGRLQIRRGRRGSRSSVMRETVCGASTCFDANRPSCAHTGCSP